MKGRLVRELPYKVRPSGLRGRVVTLHWSTGLEVGDEVEQRVAEDGAVILRKVVKG